MMAAADQLFLAPGEQFAGRLVGHADDAVGRGHEHRVGHAAEHVGQVVLVDGRLAQFLAHALERRLQLAELVAAADFERSRVVALRNAIGALDERGDGGVHAAAGPPGERQADRERDDSQAAGQQQRLAHLHALHRIELRACRARFLRAFARADFDFDFADGLRRHDARHGLHIGTQRCAGAARDAGVTVCLAPPGVDLVTRGVAQHHAEHGVVTREAFDLRVQQLRDRRGARHRTRGRKHGARLRPRAA